MRPMFVRGRHLALMIVAAALATNGCTVHRRAHTTSEPAGRTPASTPGTEPTRLQIYRTWGFTLDRPMQWKAYPYSFEASLFDLIGYLSTDPLQNPCTTSGRSFSCGGDHDPKLIERLHDKGVIVRIGNSGSPGVTS